MTMMRLHGKWVKFPAAAEAFPGAHRSPDGKVVGIYQEGGRDPVDREVEVPSRIMVVDPDGYNLVLSAKGQVADVTADPGSVKFELVMDRLADCPHERVKHLMPDK